MTGAGIRNWACLTFDDSPQRVRFSSLFPASTSHLYPWGQDSTQDRTGLSWNYGCWILPAKTPGSSGIFQKQNYFPAPGHVFTVSCASKTKGTNFKAVSAALH